MGRRPGVGDGGGGVGLSLALDGAPGGLDEALGGLSPEAVWHAATALGAAWRLATPARRALAESQLLTSIPHLEPVFARRIIRRMFRHLAAIPLEVLLARPAASHPNAWTTDLGPAGVVKVRGRRHVTRVLSRGRGALLLSAHLGNFELALLAEASRGLPLTVLTKRMSSDLVDTVWHDRRRTFGARLLPDDHSLPRVLRALSRGRCVAMALDQHANPEHAVEVSFFGRTCAAHRGLALLSARTRLPVVPVFAARTATGAHQLDYHPPIDFERGGRSIKDAIAYNTQRYTDAIEAAVHANPGQWTWLHRRWKAPS